MQKKIFNLIILFIFMIVPINTKALDSNDLLIFKDYHIKTTTTISDINRKFGEPKIVTDSAFGGKAYSYYNDDYSDYLYIETDEDGIIRSYGAIGGNFKMSNYEEGDTVNNRYGYMTGKDISYSSSTKHTYGALQYNVDYNIVDKFWDNYLSDSKYLYAIQKHGVVATKVASKLAGFSFEITQTEIDENLFYINEQLKSNGSSLYDYGTKTGKSTSFKLISGRGSNTGAAYVPNPFLLASSAYRYSASSDFCYLFADFNVYDKSRRQFSEYYYYVNPNFLDKKESVELTEDELTKLDNVLKEYKKYMDIANEHGGTLSSDDFYSEMPNYETMPLKAGKNNAYFLEFVTHYLNMARVGIGIRPLELNLDIANSAQHKAVLSVYNAAHDLESGHDAVKPDGLDDEFYNTAMKYPAENMFYGNHLISVSTALNDGAGEPIYLGHRYNLLDPEYTEWGVGSAGAGISYGWQSVQKFNGSLKDDTELVAWPSNGIFVTSLIYPSIGNWSARFYKNYKVTDNTTVTIENLSSKRVYEINKDNLNDNRTLDIINSENQVTFFDKNITYENGDVFKITLHNIKNLNTNAEEDYTYRSVFYNPSTTEANPITDIKLDKEEVILNVGETYKLNASLYPDDATIDIIEFKSTNDFIASIRQDGLITANKSGIATITLKCNDIVKTVTVRVKDSEGNIPYYIRGDLTRNGSIEVSDATEALLKTIEELDTTEEDLLIADFDENGKINASDATEILLLYINSDY